MTAARRVGRYEILREIGRGGMATVYLARQRELDREVALKELTLLQDPEPAVARRFLREARLAGSFSHPNIVTVHDYFERGGAPYIAMEYLERGALRPYVGRLSLEQVGGVLEDVLAGLAHAEERGVVHRDLKPENLMVTGQGRTKIADFGIAKATSATTQMTNLTTAGSTLGTPRYMAPERALGQEVGPWSDLYAVGVIAFELLVGHTPFHETEEPMAVLMRQINDPIPRVDTLVPDVDPALADWIARLVEKAPEDRTRAAQTAFDELDEVLIDRLGPRWTRCAALPARPGEPTGAVPIVAPSARGNTNDGSRRGWGGDEESGRGVGGGEESRRGGGGSRRSEGGGSRRGTGEGESRPSEGGGSRRGTGEGEGSRRAGGASPRSAANAGARKTSRRAAGASSGAAAGGSRRASGAAPGGAGASPRRAALAAAVAGVDDGAVTVAPRTLRVPRSRRAGRRRLLWALVALIAVTVAAGRVLGGGGGGTGSPTDEVVPRAAERRADLSSAKTPARRADAASALAEEYERSAAGENDQRVAAREQRVADSYRAAADAARREDGSDYDDAIAAARAGERAITRQRSSGIGDSQSDDPSDDEPDGGED